MNGKVWLSQCMIVKNEEKNIERALTWGKGIVKEQIVVDTGSTDRTVEIAEGLGAKVYHFEWIDDFSAAKNYAIEQAHGNWIAFLDADEYLSKKDAKRVYDILCHIEKNIPEAKKPHILRSSLADVDETGKISSVMVQDRFFRNVKNLRYRNRIHELIAMPEDMETRIVGVEEEITIFHTGYSQVAYAETGKLKRNIELLKRELEENPENYDSMIYLGEALSAEGESQEAIKVFFEAFRNGFDGLDERQSGHVIWGLMNLIVEDLSEKVDKEFEELYNKGIESNTAYPEFDYFKGYRAFLQEDFSTTRTCLELSLKKLESYQGSVMVYMTSKFELIYTMLLKSCLEQGDMAASVRYAVSVLKINKYKTAVLNTLLDLLRRDGTKAEDCYLFLSKIYDFTTLKDKLFLIKGAKTVGYQDLDEWVEQQITEQERETLDNLRQK